MKIGKISMYSLLGKLNKVQIFFLKSKKELCIMEWKTLKKKKNSEMEELKWKTINPTIWTKVIYFHLFVLTLKLGFN
jgi:hypothetical protein